MRMSDWSSDVCSSDLEAENALTNASADHVRLAELSHATERARFAFEAARIGYDKGLTDLTSLIQTERAWLATRANYTSARAAALNKAVTVFRTLGGGWGSEESRVGKECVSTCKSWCMPVH